MTPSYPAAGPLRPSGAHLLDEEEFFGAGIYHLEDDPDASPARTRQERDQEQRETMDDQLKAARILRDAGVHPQAIAEFMTPNIAGLIVRQPTLARFWAARYPSTDALNKQATYGQYETLNAQFGFAEQEFLREGTAHLAANPEPGFAGSVARVGDIVASVGMAVGGRELVDPETGARKLENGVIVATNPTTGDESVFFPNDPKGEVAGSPTWLRKVQNKWGKEEIAKWRKRLANKGYSVAPSGGMAADLVDGLATFYRNKYLGRPDRQTPEAPSPTAKDVFDPAEVRVAVKAQFQKVFGDNPSEAELEHWTEFVMKTAGRLVRKSGDPGAARSQTFARFFEAQEETPEAAEALSQSEDDDEDERFRDILIAAASILGGP